MLQSESPLIAALFPGVEVRYLVITLALALAPTPSPSPTPKQDRLLLIVDLSGWGLSHGPLVSGVLEP